MDGERARLARELAALRLRATAPDPTRCGSPAGSAGTSAAAAPGQQQGQAAAAAAAQQRLLAVEGELAGERARRQRAEADFAGAACGPAQGRVAGAAWVGWLAWVGRRRWTGVSASAVTGRPLLHHSSNSPHPSTPLQSCYPAWTCCSRPPTPPAHPTHPAHAAAWAEPAQRRRWASCRRHWRRCGLRTRSCVGTCSETAWAPAPLRRPPPRWPASRRGCTASALAAVAVGAAARPPGHLEMGWGLLALTDGLSFFGMTLCNYYMSGEAHWQGESGGGWRRVGWQAV